jgi:hypothetical protein
MARDEHEKAKDLVEKAVEKASDGDAKGAEKLVDQARKMDPSAIDEVAQEIEQDRDQAEGFGKS